MMMMMIIIIIIIIIIINNVYNNNNCWMSIRVCVCVFKWQHPSALTLIITRYLLLYIYYLQLLSIVIHADYSPLTLDNDIALIKLAQPISFTTEVSPVCLPTTDNKPDKGMSCVVTGWGDTRGEWRPLIWYLRGGTQWCHNITWRREIPQVIHQQRRGLANRFQFLLRLTGQDQN